MNLPDNYTSISYEEFGSQMPQYSEDQLAQWAEGRISRASHVEMVGIHDWVTNNYPEWSKQRPELWKKICKKYANLNF